MFELFILNANANYMQEDNVLKNSVSLAVSKFIGIPHGVIVERAEHDAEEFVSNQAIDDAGDRAAAKQSYKAMFYEGVRELLP